MGSRMMHYCISTRVCERLGGGQDGPFTLGNLAPDVHKYMNEPKEASHFIRQDETGRKYCDLEGFYTKYLAGQRSSFHLGYYCHLLSDNIWLEEIYNQKIKWLEQPLKVEAQQKYYRDFRRLNTLLADYYRLEAPVVEVAPVSFDEVDYRFLPQLLQDLGKDFTRDRHAELGPLELLEWDEIVSCLEKSVDRCVLACT